MRFVGEALERAGHEVYYLAFEDSGLPEGVFDDRTFVCLPPCPYRYKHKIRRFFNRIWAFKKYFKQHRADVVLTAIDYDNRFVSFAIKLSLLLRGTKVILSEHGNHLGLFRNHGGLTRSRVRIMRYLSYRLSDAITFLTRFDYEHFAWLKDKRVHMPNPMSAPIPERIHETSFSKEKIILFPSRLDRNKRPLFLLEAFAKSGLQEKGWKVVMLGDGEEKPLCEQYVQSNQLAVEFLGFQKNITDWYAKSKVLALTSLSEGMPNILVESIYYRCARIAVDCITGPSELMTHDEDGLLYGVQDVDGFAQGLRRLGYEEGLIERLTEKALERIPDFDPILIANRWVQLCERVAKSS